jgi:HAMP domain-containing protein
VDSSTAGIVAIAAAALAVVALLACALLARRLRRLRAAQQLIAGDGDQRTLAEHATDLERRLAALGQEVERSVSGLETRDADLDQRLGGAITQFSVVRYDAMGEMTGHQSSSIALLDSHGTGMVLSSILHREQARLYVKPVIAGRSEFDLSPEEREALDTAMGTGP